MKDYVKDKTFNKSDLCQSPLAKGEYEDCVFNNCDLSSAYLAGIYFSDCTFVSCNLSLAKLIKTSFSNIIFKDCKMLGLHFDTCNPFGLVLQFDACTLDHSSFYELKLKRTLFKNSKLHEVDFTGADLNHAIFDNCDLLSARFENTMLEKANLITAYNYSINPELNKIKKARFSQSGIAGLLDKYDIEIAP
jgi:fluoroquinolone resistance protein